MLDPDARRWVLAYGSNASPDRLADKGVTARGALLLPAAAWGWAAVWEARTAMTGAVPLTLVAVPGRRLEAWLLGIHESDLRDLDAGEARGSRYVLGSVGDVAVAARWHLRAALAYGPAGATVVLGDVDGGPLTHPPADLARARRGLEEGAPRLAAAALPGEVEENWPPTPLEPLDLFVYGTLRPGEERWPAVAELVDVLGEARSRGRVHTTPMGWPAAAFDDDAPTEIHGTLLRPRGDGAALYRTADAIEGEGDLFVRVAVRVDGPDGPGWAAAYAWNRGEIPGSAVADGRWVAGR